MSSTSKGISQQRKRAGAGYARTRWNATKHGLAARNVVIPGEDPAEFERLLEDYKDEWAPRGRTQARLVEELAAIDWKLMRYERVEQAFHRQTIAVGSQKYSVTLSDADARIDGLLHPRRRKRAHEDEPSPIGLPADDAIAHPEPEALAEMLRYLRRLLEFRSRDKDSLKLAVFHLPPKLQELWRMANEDPPAFARFLRSRDLKDLAIERPDWPNFEKWVIDFAVPYLEGLRAVHAKARDHQRHLTALMDLTAMEGLEGVWRYEDRLLAQRKNALAVLLRLQGK